MLGKNLMLSQKTSTVLMMYSIFNISTSSQFRTVPYGWCGPSEHAVVSVVVAENGNGHYSVILAIIQLFSPLSSYSRLYVSCSRLAFLYSVQLFYPCVLCKVQCTYYHALAFQARSRQGQFSQFIGTYHNKQSQWFCWIQTKQKVAQLACCRCGCLRRNLE